MELLIRLVIVVWCSTVIRYTFAEMNLMKKPCLHKKCMKISNPFGITELDPTDVETRSSKFSEKSGDLFNEDVNTANVKKITEVFDNGFYSALCWIEITTVTEFKNGSNNAIREYAISFESPSDIPNTYLVKADEVIPEIVPYKIFDQDTKKSEVLNFTTTKTSGDVTVRQNRKILCGSGPIYTKEYFEWVNSNKRKIELRVSPRKQSLVASECKDDQEKSDGGNTQSHVTAKHENLSNILKQEETISKFRVTSTEDLNNSSRFSTSTVPVSQKVNEDSYKVTTQAKLLPNDETTSITARLGSESFKLAGESTSDKNVHVSPNLNKHGDIEEEIVFKIKSGLGTATGSTVSTLREFQAENYSMNSEKYITSTEETSFKNEEYSNFATSRKLTAKPQLSATRALDDFSFGSTKKDYEYEEKSTPNLQPLTVDDGQREKTTLEVETSRSDLTTYIEPNHPKGSTTASIVTNFDNSKNTQSTKFDQNPSTLSSEMTASSTTVTKVPILNTSSQKLENVNTPKSPASETFSTEKSWSTSSREEIPQTTMQVANVTTSLPQNITVSNTDNPLTVTETSKEWNITFSTVKYDPRNDSTNATVVSNQFSSENYQQVDSTPLNDTVEKISVRVNVLTDHILEGTKNGKVFRNITPLIGVEKKIEFYFKFKNQAMETYKKELGYNWDKFMQDLILKFFGNRTNENSDGLNDLNNIKPGGCKNKVVGTNENPTPELANNELNVLNSGNGVFTSNQQINNQHLLFQNQQNPTTFNKYKEKFDSIHTFTYPPMGKLVNYSQNSAILFKNKQPVLRLSDLLKQGNATANFVNYSLPLSSTFGRLEKQPMSVMLQKVINLTKTVSGHNFSGRMENGSSFHHSNIDKSNEKDFGNRVNTTLSLASDRVGGEEPVFRLMGPTEYILQKLKDFHKLVVPKHLTTETTQKPKKVEVEENNKETTKRGLFNNMFDIISSSFSSN